MAKMQEAAEIIPEHDVEFHIAAEVSNRMSEHCPENVSDEVKDVIQKAYKMEAAQRLSDFASSIQEIRENKDSLDSVGILHDTVAAVSDFFVHSQPELSVALNRAIMSITDLEDNKTLTLATQRDEYKSVGNSPIQLSIELITKSLKMKAEEGDPEASTVVYKSELIPGITLEETTDEDGRVSLIAKLADDYIVSETNLSN